jgi:nucleoid-associated protein YgaU
VAGSNIAVGVPLGTNTATRQTVMVTSVTTLDKNPSTGQMYNTYGRIDNQSIIEIGGQGLDGAFNRFSLIDANGREHAISNVAITANKITLSNLPSDIPFNTSVKLKVYSNIQGVVQGELYTLLFKYDINSVNFDDQALTLRIGQQAQRKGSIVLANGIGTSTGFTATSSDPARVTATAAPDGTITIRAIAASSTAPVLVTVHPAHIPASFTAYDKVIRVTASDSGTVTPPPAESGAAIDYQTLTGTSTRENVVSNQNVGTVNPQGYYNTLTQAQLNELNAGPLGNQATLGTDYNPTGSAQQPTVSTQAPDYSMPVDSLTRTPEELADTYRQQLANDEEVENDEAENDGEVDGNEEPGEDLGEGEVEGGEEGSGTIEGNDGETEGGEETDSDAEGEGEEEGETEGEQEGEEVEGETDGETEAGEEETEGEEERSELQSNAANSEAETGEEDVEFGEEPLTPEELAQMQSTANGTGSGYGNFYTSSGGGGRVQTFGSASGGANLQSQNQNLQYQSVGQSSTQDINSPEENLGTYKVKRGDTLWGIAEKYYGDGSLWRNILEANLDKVQNPRTMRVGITLVIPKLSHEQLQRAQNRQATRPAQVRQTAQRTQARPPAAQAQRSVVQVQENRPTLVAQTSQPAASQFSGVTLRSNQTAQTGMSNTNSNSNGSQTGNSQQNQAEEGVETENLDEEEEVG